MERRYVPVAEIARPHGVLGELRLRIFNEQSDLLLRRPSIRLRLPDGSERDAKIDGVRPTNKALLVRFAGVVDRDAAEALRGATVCVPRDLFPPAEEGEFYACDVEGAEVVTAAGEPVGRVEGLTSYPTCDALVVALGPALATKKMSKVEIPLVESYVASVDVERRTVTLVTLEGLL
ncbi:MAG TPA: ribosome maturation factor RimM [Candidatus Nanopelagicales bacterium]|nr:ribosome maturation factor RimM [Candidatus Nanopelagicales bacterium]